MQPNELLEKLEARGIEVLDNQPIANAMAAGCETIAMMGPPPGAESLINGGFLDTMPAAIAAPQQQQEQVMTFNLPTTPGMS